MGGFVVFFVVTRLFHPAGDENDHRVIFEKYADTRLDIHPVRGRRPEDDAGARSSG